MANNLISYDLPVLQSAEKEYQQYAREITTMMGKINSLVTQKLAAGWKGASYDSFLEQEKADVEPALKKMNEALVIMAGQIRTAVQNAEAADTASKVRK